MPEGYGLFSLKKSDAIDFVCYLFKSYVELFELAVNVSDIGHFIYLYLGSHGRFPWSRWLAEEAYLQMVALPIFLRLI